MSVCIRVCVLFLENKMGDHKRKKQLTLIEYAVPSTKLMNRAQNSGHDPTIHPSQKLCNNNQ